VNDLADAALFCWSAGKPARITGRFPISCSPQRGTGWICRFRSFAGLWPKPWLSRGRRSLDNGRSPMAPRKKQLSTSASWQALGWKARIPPGRRPAPRRQPMPSGLPPDRAIRSPLTWLPGHRSRPHLKRSGASELDATRDDCFCSSVVAPSLPKPHVFPPGRRWLPAKRFQPLPLTSPPFQPTQQIPTTALDAQRIVLLPHLSPLAAVVLRHGRLMARLRGL